MARLSFLKSNSNGDFVSEEKKASLLSSFEKPIPLKSEWVVWEHACDKSVQGYADAMREVTSFKTLQDFWHMYHKMPQPSELFQGRRLVREREDGGLQMMESLMIFRKGIRPEWEDPHNRQGGHFQFHLKPAVGGVQVDEYWNNLVLALIGEILSPSKNITGLRLVDKLSGPRSAGVIRIEVWFSAYDNAMVTMRKTVERVMACHLDGSTGTIPRFDLKPHGSGHKN